MKKVGAFQAKTHLSELLADVAERHEEVVIQKRGNNVAVLISFEDYTHREQKPRRALLLDGFREIREGQKSGEEVPVKNWIKADRKR
jgi:prevent-host-death family protein